LLTHFLPVVGFVGCNRQWRFGRVEHVAHDLAVMNLAARRRKVQRPTLAIDDGMDFRGATTATDTDRLVLLPPSRRHARDPLSPGCAERNRQLCRITNIGPKTSAGGLAGEIEDHR
jgi:hypothetical protein